MTRDPLPPPPMDPTPARVVTLDVHAGNLQAWEQAAERAGFDSVVPWLKRLADDAAGLCSLDPPPPWK